MAVDDQISEAQCAAIQLWVDAAKIVMHLKDWDIQVHTGEPEEGAWASIDLVGSYRQAVMTVAPKLLRQPDPVVVHTLVHELTHLHHGDINGAMVEAVESVDPAIKAIVLGVLDRYVERMVDQISKVIAEGMVHQLPGVNGFSTHEVGS